MQARFFSTSRTTLALAFFVPMLTSTVARADSFTLAWDANSEPTVMGYYVSIGTSPGVYATIVDVGSATTYTFAAAQPGTTYYATVSAYIPGPTLGPPAPELTTTTAGGPTLSNPGNRTSPRGTALMLSLSATDPNNDPIVFGALGLPAGLSLNPATGAISGTPTSAGTFNVSVTASDPSASIATQAFTWTIVATDTTAPTIAITSPTSSATYATSSAFITLTGTAADDVGVTSVTWANSAGGSGTAAGTLGWSVVVPMQSGTNVLTITATDGAGKSSSTGLTVTMSVPAPMASAPSTLNLTTLTANQAAPQMAGTTVTFTAAVAGGASPYQYKWWLFNGVSWSVKQDWSSKNTFAWTPTRSSSAYQIRVWVRSAGSSADAPESGAALGTIAFPIKSVRRTTR